MNNLPKMISVQHGLQDKIHELNRNLPMRERVDGLQVEYEKGEGRVFNRRTNETLGRYVFVTNSGKTDKFKLVKAA